ncbi:G-patch domain and KOW motifs-containing protein [Linepithema humile]|uniref:G-patch domain and KOW motifs-containing protein n=1 Tax=Linepithema humile TaxID=83485 RepID=UPI00351E7908
MLKYATVVYSLSKMADEGKKISFGFAKSIKKPTLVKQIPQEEKKVDYIECLDEKAIKVIGVEEKKEEHLIIPLLGSKTWHDRIVNKIDADIFESKASKNDTQTVTIKEEPKEISNGDLTLVNNSVSNTQIKSEPLDESESKTLTLEEQAAKEIIEDLKSTEKKDDKLSNLTLPLAEEQNLRGVAESTLDDYEKIPVDAFGLAMLRGMGWKPGKGIGKNEKIVETVVPELRPAGMGLGADKIALQKQNGKVKEEEELRMEKGSFIKIIAGKQSNTYGQIEGFDQDAGRLIVKMALNGNTISVNECLIQIVTKAEYMKNSKVLNAAKYEEYKNKESGSKRRSTSLESSSSSDNSNSDISDRKRRNKEDDNGHKSKKSRKKSKDRRRRSSDSDSDNKKRSKKRRRSSSSDTEKRTKKSKKHKEKDKERRRQKEKTSKYSESLDRRKSKKSKRSSSRR